MALDQLQWALGSTFYIACIDYNIIDEVYQSNFQRQVLNKFGKEYEGTADYDNAASVWGTRWLRM